MLVLAVPGMTTVCIYDNLWGHFTKDCFVSNRLDLDEIVPDESKQFDCPIVVLNRLEKVITFFRPDPRRTDAIAPDLPPECIG